MLFSRTTRVNRARFSVCLAQKTPPITLLVCPFVYTIGDKSKIERKKKRDDDVTNTDDDDVDRLRGNETKVPREDDDDRVVEEEKENIIAGKSNPHKEENR